MNSLLDNERKESRETDRDVSIRNGPEFGPC